MYPLASMSNCYFDNTIRAMFDQYDQRFESFIARRDKQNGELNQLR